MQNRISESRQCLTLVIIALAIASAAQAQTYAFSTIYNFQNNGHDPIGPEAPMIIDTAGNLYGTSSSGGDFNLGTAFKVTKSGVVSVLHSYKGGSDGFQPNTGLVRDAARNLYGTAFFVNGGITTGIVFKLSPSGQETILHIFTGGTNGDSASRVVLDPTGNIYGTASTLEGSGGGLVFKIDANENFSILYNFCSLPNCADGKFPATQSSPILDKAGNLYGVTTAGGTTNNGTVFKLTPSGVETALHSFNGNDGILPQDLKQDTRGNLYVTTRGGGSHNEGALFKQPEAGGAGTVLYSFCSLSNCTDGQLPLGPVQIDRAGNLYGTTVLSDVRHNGSVAWEVNASDKETILYTFPKETNAEAGLTIDSVGNLYGTTFTGGANRFGSIFKLTLQ